MTQFDDSHFMAMALEEAQKGASAGEIPIGAVLVMNGEVIARDHNRCLATNDPTAHAEIIVIRKAARRLRNYRLLGCHLYITIEPCAMCIGAMIQGRVSRLIFGALEEKTGMVQSRLALLNDSIFNHRIEVVGGVLAEDCRKLIQGFFREKRENMAPSASFSTE